MARCGLLYDLVAGHGTGARDADFHRLSDMMASGEGHKDRDEDQRHGKERGIIPSVERAMDSSSRRHHAGILRVTVMIMKYHWIG